MLGIKPRAHERIVWSGSWSPDSRLIATGSRDRQVRVWPFDPSNPSCPTQPLLTLSKLAAPVTAVAFAPSLDARGAALLTVGLENGAVSVLRISPGHDGCLESSTVRRLPVREYYFQPMHWLDHPSANELFSFSYICRMTST